MTKPETEKLPVLPPLPEPRLRPYKHLGTVYYNAGQMKEYARAYALAAIRAQGGGEVRNDPSWSLFDRVDFALRDAGFDYDEAARIAHLADTPQPDEPVAVDGELPGMWERAVARSEGEG